MSPSETALLANVLVGSGILFVIAYLGNALTFSNRFVNALVTALVFAVFYAALIYTVDKTVLPPELKEATRDTWVQMVLMAAGLVFVLDLIANFISFNNRFLSALITAVLFAVLFGVAVYTTGDMASTGVPSTGQPVNPQPAP
jgi:hypothetical protein